MPGAHTFYDGSRLLDPLAEKVGLSVDKVNLVICQFISLPLAVAYYKWLPAEKYSKNVRLVYPLIIGLFMCLFCYGGAIKHLLANAGACYLLLVYSPTKFVHKTVFCTSMAYLSFIHGYRSLYLMSYNVDITGPMMVLVQKVTTLAFSLHDGKCKSVAELNPTQRREALRRPPTILEYLSYLFYFQAVFAGPMCFFADYMEFIQQKRAPIMETNDTQPNDSIENEALLETSSYSSAEEHLPKPWKAVCEKLFWCSIFLALCIFLAPSYQPESMLRSPIADYGPVKWCATFYLVMALARVHYYFVWMLADALCNASGLGYSRAEANWDLVSNVHVWKCETALSWKETLDVWNCTTGTWLRRVAYDRTSPRFRTVYTYILSAWWHGFFPGYYLTFLTGALLTVAGRTARRCLRHRFLVDRRLKLFYDLMTFLATKTALTYATFPFVTMKFAPGWILFSQTYFFMHIIALLIIFVLPIICPQQQRHVLDKSLHTK